MAESTRAEISALVSFYTQPGIDGVGSAAVFVYYSDFAVLVILMFKGVRVLKPCVYRG